MRMDDSETYKPKPFLVNLLYAKPSLTKHIVCINIMQTALTAGFYPYSLNHDIFNQSLLQMLPKA